eukprot:GHVT01011710.1.p1 GENE.GHVT01011710.1~~GHVT01011710.1.p1  ORF type:complete len:142 (-),score=16.49 GHVT01011710.1:951-1376(-)
MKGGTYSSKTLQGNWFEDRLAEAPSHPELLEHKTVRALEPDVSRRSGLACKPLLRIARVPEATGTDQVIEHVSAQDLHEPNSSAYSQEFQAPIPANAVCSRSGHRPRAHLADALPLCLAELRDAAESNNTDRHPPAGPADK